MKKLVSGALLLASAATACQHHTPATASAATAPKASVAIGKIAATPDTTVAVLALLRQVDLAPAWGNKTESAKAYGAMDGFYSLDNYRISFYFDQVRRDSLRPNVFHFQGRDRYKKVITPFAGTITVTRLAPLPDTTMLVGLHGPASAYTAFASFELHENTRAKGAGHCQGRAALDFYIDQQQQVQVAVSEIADLAVENPTQGCGLVFRGTWQDNRTGRRYPVSWANYYGVIIPNVLHEMGLGSRSDEVNPKLARYGWNTIMENDEWWASSPKSTLLF